MSAKTTNPNHGSSVDVWFAEEEARQPGWLARIDAEIDREIIAAKVRSARKRAGISQAQLAHKVGTQQPGIARVESGKVIPTLDLLHKIARALDNSLIIGFAPKKAAAKKKRSTAAARTTSHKRHKLTKGRTVARNAAPTARHAG
jgi:transcriptional regulator with XRE-family HTH domain